MERDRQFPPKVLRFSELKRMALSPAHFRAAYEDPIEQTPYMRFGSLVHALLLRGDSFEVYDGERRGNAWKDFKAKVPEGKLIVTASEHAEALRVSTAVLNDPVARPLVEGLHETEITWEMLGRKCAGRVDILGQIDLVDLKLTHFAQPEYFARFALRSAYHAQVAWYGDGARANGHSIERAHIIAVESKPPFAVVVMPVTPRALEEGRKMIRLWIERLGVCEAAGEWPGYTQCPIPLDVVEDAGLIIEGEEVAA